MARILQVFRPRTGGTFSHVGVLARELQARATRSRSAGRPGDGPDLGVRFIRRRHPAGHRLPRAGRAARGVRDVGRAYRAFRPDLIHAHGAQAGVTARLARAALPGAPLIHTPHRYAFDDGRGRTRVGPRLRGRRAGSDAARDPRPLRLRGRGPPSPSGSAPATGRGSSTTASIRCRPHPGLRPSG